MHWVRRIGRHPPPAAPTPDPAVPEPAERITPGLAAVFERVSEDRSHAVLDLGSADGSSLRVYSRFARWVRFADVLDSASSPAGRAAALSSLPPNPERPYDLVFAWDILDRLPPQDRPGLVARLAELSAPGARLFIVVESSDLRPTDLLRFTLAGIDRVRYESTGEPRPVHAPVLPADVKRLIEPFQVHRAFSTRVGLREYVAVLRANGVVP